MSGFDRSNLLIFKQMKKKRKLVYFEADIELLKEIWDGQKKVPAKTKFVDKKCFAKKYHPDTAIVEKTEKQLESDKVAAKAEEEIAAKEKLENERKDLLLKQEEQKRKEDLKKKIYDEARVDILKEFKGNQKITKTK